MINDKYEIIGPCSKNINGKGWVTEVTEAQLNAIGFVKAPTVSEPSDGSTAKEPTEKK